MFWGFLLGGLYLGTDNQLFQILHALRTWQKKKKKQHPKTPRKTSLGGKKIREKCLVLTQTKGR